MARVLYFDCFSGISGDMILGALLDAGLPFDELKRALGSLAVSGYDLTASRVLRAGVSATKFSVVEHGHPHVAAPAGAPDHVHAEAGDDQQAQVHAHGHEHSHPHVHGDDHGHDHSHPHEHPHTHPHVRQGEAPIPAHGPSGHTHGHGHAHRHVHRSLPEIFRLIDQAALSPAARTRAQALFQRLAEAEAAIHQMPVEQVHLHEVGALDSIIDIVGAVFALEWFGADRIVCSPLNVGGGMVQSAHGHFPVPAPATLRLLGDAPIYSGQIQKELVTPTGALIATSYAQSYGPIPAMTVEHVGYGAGDREFASTPNVLRVIVGRAADHAHAHGDHVTVIECEIDDMNPQIFGVVMDRLYAAGALEVFYVPVQMKKNRPGTLLTVVCAPDRRQSLADIVFAETTTIGVRYSETERECLAREMVTVATSAGPIRLKVARRHGRVVNAQPEFEDCARAASAHNLSVKQVQALAAAAYAATQGSWS